MVKMILILTKTQYKALMALMSSISLDLFEYDSIKRVKNLLPSDVSSLIEQYIHYDKLIDYYPSKPLRLLELVKNNIHYYDPYLKIYNELANLLSILPEESTPFNEALLELLIIYKNYNFTIGRSGNTWFLCNVCEQNDIEETQEQKRTKWESAVRGMVDGNHLDLIKKYYKERSYRMNTNILTTAAKRGHQSIVEWCLSLLESESFYNLDRIANEAAEKGHLIIVKQLINRGKADPNYALFGAAKYGQLDIVQYLLNTHIKSLVLGASLTVASSYGHEDTVKCILQNPIPYEQFESALEFSQENGYVDIFNLLIDARSSQHE